jgi:hypothetical protein
VDHLGRLLALPKRLWPYFRIDYQKTLRRSLIRQFTNLETSVPEANKEFLKLLADKGLTKEKIMQAWKHLFPSNDWMKDFFLESVRPTAPNRHVDDQVTGGRLPQVGVHEVDSDPDVLADADGLMRSSPSPVGSFPPN